MTTPVVHVPEPVQLVDIGLRRYVVVDVVYGTVLADLLGKTGPLMHPQSQHLVLLNLVEDDDLGEELHVIWRSSQVSMS